MIRAQVVQPKLVYDIRAFGAVGDAVQAAPAPTGVWSGNDNSTAINNAIAWAELVGGATVIVPEGNYLCKSSVNMGNNVTLQGNGGWLILAGSPDAFGQHLVRADDLDHFVIRGLKLDGNKYNRPTEAGNSVHCIRVHDCSNYYITECEIHRSPTFSISSDVNAVNAFITFNRIFDSRADGIDCHNTGLTDSCLEISFNLIDGYCDGDAEPRKAGIHGRGQGIAVCFNVVKNNLDTTLGGIFGILIGNGEDYASVMNPA